MFEEKVLLPFANHSITQFIEEKVLLPESWKENGTVSVSVDFSVEASEESPRLAGYIKLCCCDGTPASVGVRTNVNYRH